MEEERKRHIQLIQIVHGKPTVALLVRGKGADGGRFPGHNYNYLTPRKISGEPLKRWRTLTASKWARCAAKQMIYDLAAAAIKLHFPRAVLMTWRQRHFITAAAPAMDTDRAQRYCPLDRRAAPVPQRFCPASERVG